MGLLCVYGSFTIYNAFGSVLSACPEPVEGVSSPSGVPRTVANRFMFTGREYDPETGNYYYRARFYNPQIGRFLSPDPLGYADSMNLYQYCGNNPINLIDPYGENIWDTIITATNFTESTLWKEGTNFVAGMGDNLSFGITSKIREFTGSNSFVDRGTSAYKTGEWSGVALSVATGVAGGIKAAGVKSSATEFSHWIPDRYLKKAGSNWLRNTFGRSRFNGNWVTSARQYLHDPFRYPPNWRSLGPKLNSTIQQLDRIPNLIKGTGLGFGYGISSMGVNKK